LRSFAWTVIATANNVGRSARGTSASNGVWGERPGDSVATHALLLSKSSKTSTVAFLFNCHCSLVGMTFLLLLEGGEILATFAFDIHILEVKVKVRTMAVVEGRRGLRAECIEHSLRR
jgi:hypothetical protein